MRDDRPGASGAAVSDRTQGCYARLLWWSGWTSLVVLVLGFAVYAGGLLPPLIDVAELPQAWTLSAHELRQHRGHPAGWSWVRLLGRGDIFNLMGIALLAGCSAVPLLAVAVLYWRGGDRTYALLAAAQVLVLAAAASGLIAAGH
jgi:hypothetical protein